MPSVDVAVLQSPFPYHLDHRRQHGASRPPMRAWVRPSTRSQEPRPQPHPWPFHCLVQGANAARDQGCSRSDTVPCVQPFARVRKDTRPPWHGCARCGPGARAARTHGLECTGHGKTASRHAVSPSSCVLHGRPYMMKRCVCSCQMTLGIHSVPGTVGSGSARNVQVTRSGLEARAAPEIGGAQRSRRRRARGAGRFGMSARQ